MTVTGVWERHPQHGEQLRASEVERSLPEDEAHQRRLCLNMDIGQLLEKIGGS